MYYTYSVSMLYSSLVGIIQVSLFMPPLDHFSLPLASLYFTLNLSHINLVYLSVSDIWVQCPHLLVHLAL